MRSNSHASPRFRALITYAAVTLLTACGGDKKTPTPPVVSGTLAVAASPAALTVVAGASGSSAATITRGGSFTGDVALTAEGAPAGVTVTFATPTLGAGVTSSAISGRGCRECHVGESIPIAIKATGTGVTVASATLTLTVTPAASPTLAVSVAPTPVAIIAGATGTTTATVVRGGGFAGIVTLASTVAQSGITVSLTPPRFPLTSSTRGIGIAVAGTVPAGTYPVTINATAPASPPRQRLQCQRLRTQRWQQRHTQRTVRQTHRSGCAYQDGNGAMDAPKCNRHQSYHVQRVRGPRRRGDGRYGGNRLRPERHLCDHGGELNGFGTTQASASVAARRSMARSPTSAMTQFANVSLGYSTSSCCRSPAVRSRSPTWHGPAGPVRVAPHRSNPASGQDHLRRAVSISRTVDRWQYSISMRPRPSLLRRPT